ncbi:alpha-E domain-containing protein [Caulobacter sp. FWC2]|uniref:alpha-E domain-containing protein n=1 Tax=Caulobacter sp. FWC2 TaxID=69664 RepID=UPI000C159613|nr:alpha-E domain-containing protein [Caulobacter sp. FWC2]PIB91763.1 hypothetical protein CSW62_09370 [Caulobacter sp. FWC2]
MMLARVADSLYWLGRYIERAEHLSRLSSVMMNATLDQTDSGAHAVRIAMAAVGDPADGVDIGSFEAAEALVLDRSDTNSVVSSLARARENARQVRDQITTETWERLNLLYLKVTDVNAGKEFSDGSANFLHDVIADLHLFKGAADTTMSHGESWRFMMLGIYMERAQLVSRLLEVCFAESPVHGHVDDHVALVSVLRMACALEPYLRVYTAEIEPRHILEFLVFDEDFPRSIRFATAQIEQHLSAMARNAFTGERPGPERLAGRLKARLQFADVDELEAVGAGPLLTTVVNECARIHEAIYETFVAYPLETRLPA